MAAYDVLFPAVLRMSLTGSIVIVLVLLARLVLRHAPRIFSYLLWGVVLLRLLCPVSFSSVLSVFQVIDTPISIQALSREGTAFAPQGIVWLGPQEGLSAEELSFPGMTGEQPVMDKEAAARSFWSVQAVCGLVWLSGAAALWIYSIVRALGLRRRLVGALRCEKNIYLCDYIGTAFVLGVLRPRIYLPTALTREEREYILLHERTHIRRGDHILRLLAFLALSVHWFNPLVWCAFFLSERDMEMSCDETVLRKSETDIRVAYSASLLNLASGKRVFAGAPLGFGEGNVKCRIKNIMRYKKKAALIAVPVLALVVIVFITLGSNPVRDEAKSGQQADVSGDNRREPLSEAEQIAITTPVMDQDMICGADGPFLDYADERMLIFHDYFGLFVYNTEENTLAGAVDLKAIGCQYTQGDAYCEVMVSKDGQTVYLHPLNIKEMYVYETAAQALTRQPYDMEGVELFGGLRATRDCVEPDYTVLRSTDCVPLQEERRLYLESGSGMAADLYYVIEQNGEWVQFAKLFEPLPEQETLGGEGYDISPEEAAVIPEVGMLSYEDAVRRGTVREYDRETGGTLPGLGLGVWYSVEVDGIEYLYGRYDHDEENCSLFSWALRDDSHVLANGIRVGMTAEEVLAACPDMVRIGFDGEGYPAWNRSGYPKCWTDAFDDMLIADIEDNEDNLPIFLALMLKEDRVVAITKYVPTAG